MELENKICVITGATSGIGEATVYRFVEEGARVVFCGRRADRGKVVEDKANGRSKVGCAKFFQCDVSNEADAKALADFVKSTYGNCEVLFNNAGVHQSGKLHETKPEDWNRIMRIDVFGCYIVAYYLIPQMLEKKYGTIINMSSVSGMLGDTDMVAYNTAKGAITNMTRCMAIDYAADGIRVNAVCPGITRTEISQYTFDSVPGAEDAFKNAVPVHYVAEAEQVAEMCVFLAARKVDFLNGVNIPLDGGMTAHTGQPYMGKY